MYHHRRHRHYSFSNNEKQNKDSVLVNVENNLTVPRRRHVCYF